jgi:hypothetical protein
MYMEENLMFCAAEVEHGNESTAYLLQSEFLVFVLYN